MPAGGRGAGDRGGIGAIPEDGVLEDDSPGGRYLDIMPGTR